MKKAMREMELANSKGKKKKKKGKKAAPAAAANPVA